MGKRRKPVQKSNPEAKPEEINQDDLIFSGGEDSDDYESFAKMGLVFFEEITGADAEEFLSKVVTKKDLMAAEDSKNKPSAKKAKTEPKESKNTEVKTKKADAVTKKDAEKVAEVPVLKAKEMIAWRKYPLADDILAGLKRQKFTKPTPIQELTLQTFYGEKSGPRDIMGTAPTGSGKTLAFGLPILNHIVSLKEGQEAFSALIIAPTRELALQIKEHLSAVEPSARLAILIGGMSSEKQDRLLSRNPHVIIGTPGRLDECIGMDSELAQKIAHVPFLVIDEADRLVESGHFKELDSILAAVYRDTSFKDRHTFLFSATLDFESSSEQKGGQKKTKNPLDQLKSKIKFSGLTPTVLKLSSKTKVADKIDISKAYSLPEEKDLYLIYYLLSVPFTKVLVFVNAIDILKRVAPVLQVFGIPCSTLHAQMQQRQRLQHLDKFKAAPKMVMVTSDVSARGLDISAVDKVVHYHLPRSTDTFIHRCGRTGRAERSGVSLALISPQEVDLEDLIVKKLGLGSLPEERIDLAKLDRLKTLVDIARKIETLESKLAKSTKEESWETKAAEDLGLDLDDVFGRGKYKNGEDEDIHGQATKKTKAQIAALRTEFESMRKILRL